MTFTSYPFPNQDTTESQYQALFSELQDNGVIGQYGGSDLQVTANSSAMAVTMQPGSAIIRGVKFDNDAVWTQAVDAAGASTRYDAIILRLDTTANQITPVYVANSGLTPTLTRNPGGIWEILLALITVQSGDVTVAAGRVTDMRQFVRRRVGVWTTTNRPSSPRSYDMGFAVDKGGRPEYNDPSLGWVNLGSRFWGTGTAFPTTGIQAGDTYFRQDIGTNGSMWQYTGKAALGSAGWLPVDKIICTSGTKPASPYKYMRIETSDDGSKLWYDGTNWRVELRSYSPGLMSGWGGNGVKVNRSYDVATVTVDVAWNGGSTISLGAWASAYIIGSGNLPKPDGNKIATSIPSTNAADGPEFSLGVTQAGELILTSRWVAHDFPNGSWVQGSFAYSVNPTA